MQDIQFTNLLARVLIFSCNFYPLLNKIQVLNGQIIFASPVTSCSNFHWLECMCLWEQRWSTALSQQNTHYTSRCFYFHIAKGALWTIVFFISQKDFPVYIKSHKWMLYYTFKEIPDKSWGSVSSTYAFFMNVQKFQHSF